MDENGKFKYSVFKKDFHGEWVKIMSTIRKAKAFHRKHIAWLGAIHNMGKTGFILERRKKRALTPKQKRELIARFEERAKQKT
jgi:hypothetical protein